MPFKSVTEHCTSGTVCITLHWSVLRVPVQCFVTNLNGVTKNDQIKYELRK